MSSPFPDLLRSQLYHSGVIAVLILDQVETAVPVARALLAGGVNCIELTLRTSVAFDCLKRIRAEVPEMTIGVGTILTPKQVEQAMQAGASFGVSPGMNPKVVAEASHIGLPFAPGVCTPTDIEMAISEGCRVFKFFPCEPSGGLPYLRSLSAPFLHLDVQFIPLGGVNASNAKIYLQEPAVLALGGSWLAPKELIASQNWDKIRELATDITETVQCIRP
jgi:2-dehydro-3-deoxyphosphogluconate aldolase/(4S)-4-hydroxy-2-oxoglutarate aldolase